MSHPSWVRGLKHVFVQMMLRPLLVAPLVGAWIETSTNLTNCTMKRSHPSWVRGLKLQRVIIRSRNLRSHPSWVRGLKPSHVYKSFDDK